MNFSDSEIIASVMKKNNFLLEKNHKKSDIIFINTCSIRKKAEERIEKRISQFNEIKKKNKKLIIGILGCMAKRMKFKLFKEKKTVDLIIGPDSYRNIPKLINNIKKGKKAYSVLLSKKETYEDINPVKINSNKINSFISIMRGCNNMCSFCIVPFTRGRERSRNPDSIIKEVKYLFIKGYREVTLLGQNVDSYN
jgi:tRNA-2-methylthio-N6-dimethylallyladenosine synthase